MNHVTRNRKFFIKRGLQPILIIALGKRLKCFSEDEMYQNHYIKTGKCLLWKEYTSKGWPKHFDFHLRQAI